MNNTSNSSSAPSADTAEVLFGGSAPGAPPAPTGNVSAPPSREATPAEVLFTPTDQYRETVRTDLDELRDLGYDETAIDKHAAAAAEAFNDATFAEPVARDLHSLLVGALKTPASDEQLATWSAEAEEAGRQRHGKEYDERLAKVRAFVEQRNDLKRLLVETGIGSHPRMVTALLERAHQLRAPRTKP